MQRPIQVHSVAKSAVNEISTPMRVGVVNAIPVCRPRPKRHSWQQYSFETIDADAPLFALGLRHVGWTCATEVAHISSKKSQKTRPTSGLGVLSSFGPKASGQRKTRSTLKKMAEAMMSVYVSSLCFLIPCRHRSLHCSSCVL